MKAYFTRTFVSIILFTLLGVAISPRASGQATQLVVPTRLYRFVVSPSDGGRLLTGYYQEGPANGYAWESTAINIPGDGNVGMYVPPSGYTPDPSSGLVALHRWTVIQNGWRTHYYYSTYYTVQPPDRFYNGIAGYVFPPGTTQTPNGLPLHQLSVFYSQTMGFWNGYGADGYGYQEQPPAQGNYQDQGIIAALPPSVFDYEFPPQPNTGPPFQSVWRVLFYAPSPPGGGGGSCNPSSGTLNACHHNGGEWDYFACTCQY